MNAYRHFLVNQSRHTADPAYEPPPEPEYFLWDRPRDHCPWCKTALTRMHVATPEGMELDCPSCDDWDWGMTQDENRIRYAAERLADAQVRQP